MGKEEEYENEDVLGQSIILDRQTASLPANTAVALHVEEDVNLMNGRYVDSRKDLGEVQAEAKKGQERIVTSRKGIFFA